MDSLDPSGRRGQATGLESFQLHVMDSEAKKDENVIAYYLSTPCNGFTVTILLRLNVTLRLSTPCNGFATRGRW